MKDKCVRLSELVSDFGKRLREEREVKIGKDKR